MVTVMKVMVMEVVNRGGMEVTQSRNMREEREGERARERARERGNMPA